MNTPLHVLLVEDSAEDAQWLLRELRAGGYAPTYARVETAEAMRAALADETWDAIIADHALPRFSGLAALALMAARKIRSNDVGFSALSWRPGGGRARR